MESLFAHLPPRRFPPQRTRKASGPARNRHAERYGPSNPSIFTLVLREEVTVAPIARQRPLLTLAEKDPFGEWRNAEDEAHAATLAALLRLPNDYEASVAFIRAHRPEQAPDALRFWRAPLTRAHLLNALLCRGGRTVAQLHRDMRLKEGNHARLHEYLRRWGVEWSRPERAAQLVDGSGAAYDVRVVHADPATGAVRVRLTAYTLTVDARYDARARVYRTPETLDLASLLPLPVAAALAGLTPGTARAVLPITTHSAPARVPLVRPEDLARTVPEQHWRTSLKDALRDANPCRCAFWDHHAKGCGLGRGDLPAPGTAAYACEDHDDA